MVWWLVLQALILATTAAETDPIVLRGLLQQHAACLVSLRW